MQFATNTGAQLPTSSIIILTEMFAFCLSVSHFHKQNGRKMMGVHCTRSSAQVKNAEHFYLSEARNSPSRRLSECLSSPILWASKEWDEGFIARL